MILPWTTQLDDLAILSPPSNPWWLQPKNILIPETLTENKTIAEQNDTRLQKQLMKISAVFPFDFFPDSVTVDPDKVNVICRNILGTQQISSVLIDNISHVDVNTGIFTATLNITDSTNIREPIHISAHNLANKDALKVRKLIQGLITSRKHNIPLSKLDPLNLKDEAEKLGAEITNGETAAQPKIAHYYGDLIRMLYFVAGLLMLLFLPFFHELIIIPINLAILIILGLVLLAGIINPNHFFIAFLESMVSASLFLVFENEAMKYFIVGRSQLYAMINQLLAIIFFIATYFSIKTTRGFLLRK